MEVHELLDRLYSSRTNQTDQVQLLNELERYSARDEFWKSCCARLMVHLPITHAFFYLNSLQKFVAQPARWALITNNDKATVRETLVHLVREYNNVADLGTLHRKACQSLVLVGKRECCGLWMGFAELVREEVVRSRNFNLLHAACDGFSDEMLFEGLILSSFHRSELKEYRAEVASTALSSALSDLLLVTPDSHGPWLSCASTLLKWIDLKLIQHSTFSKVRSLALNDDERATSTEATELLSVLATRIEVTQYFDEMASILTQLVDRQLARQNSECLNAEAIIQLARCFVPKAVESNPSGAVSQSCLSDLIRLTGAQRNAYFMMECLVCWSDVIRTLGNKSSREYILTAQSIVSPLLATLADILCFAGKSGRHLDWLRCIDTSKETVEVVSDGGDPFESLMSEILDPVVRSGETDLEHLKEWVVDIARGIATLEETILPSLYPFLDSITHALRVSCKAHSDEWLLKDACFLINMVSGMSKLIAKDSSTCGVFIDMVSSHLADSCTFLMDVSTISIGPADGSRLTTINIQRINSCFKCFEGHLSEIFEVARLQIIANLAQSCLRLPLNRQTQRSIVEVLTLLPTKILDWPTLLASPSLREVQSYLDLRAASWENNSPIKGRGEVAFFYRRYAQKASMQDCMHERCFVNDVVLVMSESTRVEELTEVLTRLSGALSELSQRNDAALRSFSLQQLIGPYLRRASGFIALSVRDVAFRNSNFLISSVILLHFGCDIGPNAMADLLDGLVTLASKVEDADLKICALDLIRRLIPTITGEYFDSLMIPMIVDFILSLRLDGSTTDAYFVDATVDLVDTKARWFLQNESRIVLMSQVLQRLSLLVDLGCTPSVLGSVCDGYMALERRFRQENGNSIFRFMHEPQEMCNKVLGIILSKERDTLFDKLGALLFRFAGFSYESFIDSVIRCGCATPSDAESSTMRRIFGPEELESSILFEEALRTILMKKR